MILSELHQAWIRDLAARGLSDKTISAYKGDFNVMRAYLGSDDLRALTAEKIAGYVGWLGTRKSREKGDSPRTIQRRLASASSFVEWLVTRGDMGANPFRLVKRPKRPRRLPRGCPVESLDAVFQLKLPARDKVILGLMRYGGLRISDIVGLDIGDVDLESGVLIIRHGKGDKDRVIPLDADLFVIVREYLGNLGKVDPNRPLLLGRGGDRITPKVVYRMLRRVTRQAGVPRFTPHPVRHTFATEAAKAGVPLHVLQAILGHADAGTTQLYFDVVGRDLKHAMAALTAWRRGNYVTTQKSAT